MAKHGLIDERMLEVADRIESDIRSRGLRPGDALAPTLELAREYQVSSAMANMALRLLTQRGVVDRIQRRGTVVAEPPQKTEAALDRIHLLLPDGYSRNQAGRLNPLLLGIQSRHPSARILINQFGIQHADQGIEQIFVNALKSRHRHGFVLVRAPLYFQRLFAESRLPTVLYGTPYPSMQSLPYLDMDNRLAGELLARSLLEAKCRDFLVMLRDRVLPGDHIFSDSILHVLGEAGVKNDRITFRFLPYDRPTIEHEVHRFLSGRGGRRGIIARNGILGDEAARILDGGALRDQPRLVAASIEEREEEAPFRHPHLNIEMPLQERGELIGQMLAGMRGQQSSAPDRVICSCSLDPGI